MKPEPRNLINEKNDLTPELLKAEAELKQCLKRGTTVYRTDDGWLEATGVTATDVFYQEEIEHIAAITKKYKLWYYFRVVDGKPTIRIHA